MCIFVRKIASQISLRYQLVLNGQVDENWSLKLKFFIEAQLHVIQVYTIQCSIQMCTACENIRFKFFELLNLYSMFILSFAVKFLREVTPYFRKASIISEVGWELQRAFLCPLINPNGSNMLSTSSKSVSPPSAPKSPPRADTRYIPLQLTHLARNLKYHDPGTYYIHWKDCAKQREENLNCLSFFRVWKKWQSNTKWIFFQDGRLSVRLFCSLYFKRDFSRNLFCPFHCVPKNENVWPHFVSNEITHIPQKIRIFSTFPSALLFIWFHGTHCVS